jgi:hypothetical protein
VSRDVWVLRSGERNGLQIHSLREG